MECANALCAFLLPSRGLVAKASFSTSSASEPVANMSGPSTPIKHSVGAILPLFRLQ